MTLIFLPEGIQMSNDFINDGSLQSGHILQDRMKFCTVGISGDPSLSMRFWVLP